MRMQLPVLLVAFLKWCAVPAHGIWKRGFEEVVVAREPKLQDLGQAPPFGVRQVRKSLHMPNRHQKILEGPRRPIWNEQNPLCILLDDARLIFDLLLQVI